MEFKKSLSGNIIIVFNTQETENFTKALFSEAKELNLFSDDHVFSDTEIDIREYHASPEPVKVDPFKKFHSQTRQFFEMLKSIYGANPIDPKCETVKNLIKSMYLRSITQSLKLLQERGYCDIVRNDNKALTIKSFTLKF